MPSHPETPLALDARSITWTRRLFNGLADATTFEDVCAVLTEVAAPVVGAANVALGIIDGDVLRVFQGPAGVRTNVGIRWVDLAQATPLTDVARHGRPQLIWSNTELQTTYPRMAQRFAESEITALHTYPLRRGSALIGSCAWRYEHAVEPTHHQSALIELSNDLLGRTSARLIEQTEIIDRTEQLERSNRDLTDFAAIVAHDFAGPIRRIGSFTQLIASAIPADDVEARRRAALVQGQVTHLDRVLRDTLDYARATAPLLHPEPIDLRVLLADIVATMDAEIGAIDVRLEIDPLPIVVATESLLRQVVQNVLDNALRYRHLDRELVIRVAADRIDHASGDEWWRVSITDNGVGIDPDRIDEMFGMFRRLTPDDGNEGTGVGLAFARRVIEQHGGTITAEPCDPQRPDGTCVSFTLPGVLRTTIV